MPEELATTQVPDRLSLVALTPGDLPAVQAQLGDWCRKKLIHLGRELREQRSNLRQAKAMHWKRTGWAKAASKTKALMIYYAKIKTAVEAGYLIVPNFDVDVIAVRVKDEGLRNPELDVETASPDLLPPGAGLYVDNKLKGYTATEKYKFQDQDRTRSTFHPTHFNTDIDFPFDLVKPAVLEATSLAMARNLFDRIGVVRGGRKSDPIVVGQIIHPKTSKWSRRVNPTCVSFFIAWWFDTEMF